LVRRFVVLMLIARAIVGGVDLTIVEVKDDRKDFGLLAMKAGDETCWS
jgi:hypothetical protein